MFKIVTSLTLSLFGLLANAQSEMRTEPFHALKVNNNATVVYKPGPDYSVRYRTDAKTAAGLITRVENGTLYISQKDGVPVTVSVTSPQLDDIVASQHAVVMAQNIKADNFSLGLASGARFNGTVYASGKALLRGKQNAVFNILLHTRYVETEFTAGTKVNLSGTAWAGTIVTHGNSHCLARNFRLDNAKVDATGLSEVEISVNGSIAVNTEDQAVVRYFGSPKKQLAGRNTVATLTE